MVKALKDEGVKVVEHAGWRTHNRAGHGAWGPVNGIIIHHTAGADSSAGLSLVYNGRSDLPGPLAHAYLSKSGTVTLTGNGRANHAGFGDGDVLDAVIAEHPLPKPNENDMDGNAHFYGIEIANLGNGKDPYPDVQYKAAVKWAAAICRAHGWSSKSVIGHKEWTNQKIDPSFSMTKFRKDVQAQLDGKTTTTPPTTKAPASTQTTTVIPGDYYFEASRTTAATLSVLGSWYDVSLPNETSDSGAIFTAGSSTFGGAGWYQGVVYFELSGVPDGDEVQARLIEKNTSGATMASHPIVEGIGTGGNTYFAYPFCGALTSGRVLGIQILNSTASMAVTVETVRIKSRWVLQ
jgi:hypothetical protein